MNTNVLARNKGSKRCSSCPRRPSRKLRGIEAIDRFVSCSQNAIKLIRQERPSVVKVYDAAEHEYECKHKRVEDLAHQPTNTRIDFSTGRPLVLGSVMLGLIAAVASFGMSRAEERKDREFQECKACPVMVGIPAGEFLMGSPATESGRFDSEGPQHQVAIKAFALGKYDVTSEEFVTFLRETGYRPRPCNSLLNMGWSTAEGGRAGSPYQGDLPRWPAVCVDWHDAEKYIAWLNGKVRLEHPAAARASGPYRLPTEAEWEYAARGNTKTARWWGDAIGKGHANCNGCGSEWDNRLFANVDSFTPNPLGLYGMLGNAWQWTADCWHPNYVGAPQDGSAWTETECSEHVIRGGSWHNLPVFVRSAARVGSEADSGESDYSGLAGFRVARDLP